MHAPIARLIAVNVVAELQPGPGKMLTAIDKRPVEGPVAVQTLGVVGDRQINARHHGGRDQAVYAFAREDVVHWETELGRSIPPGSFGENLTFEGLEVSDALVGEQWRVGGERPDAVVLEATCPRVPCTTFSNWMDEPRWVSRFHAYGRSGSYLRVITEGTVQAGDLVEVVRRPAHGVTVGQVLRRFEAAAAQALVDAHAAGEIELAEVLRRRAMRLRRGCA